MSGLRRPRFEYELVYFYPPLQALHPTGSEEVYPRPIVGRGEPFQPSVYLHLPFCTGRCAYCHYASLARRLGDTSEVEDYLDALEQEILLLKRTLPFDNSQIEAVHFGGGTPTFLSPDQIRRVMDGLCTQIRTGSAAEITWESSPETLLDDRGSRIDALLQSRVNRLNVGVQSFEASLLKVIGRRHTAVEAIRAFELAREKGFANINIDLIYGLPDQTLVQWEHTLDIVGDLRPESVTVYHLRIKRGTRIARLERSRFVSEDQCLQMGAMMLQKLEGFGYHAWQPNQFALEEPYVHRYLKSKWEAPVEVVGIGLSAYSFVDNWTYVNYRTLPEYYGAIRSGRLPIFLGKQLSCDQQMAKAVVLGIKLLPDGVSTSRFCERFGVSLDQVYGPTIARLQEAGLVELTETCLRLTRPSGLLLADEVCVEFYAEEDSQRLREVGATRYGSYLDALP